MTALTNYQVHMLRIWQESPAGENSQTGLRVSLEDPKTAVRVGFTDLEALLNYLKEKLEIPATP
jgi:hypothetical protein